MTIYLGIIALLAASAAVGSVVVVKRDGYRAIPTRTYPKSF
jgi:hypothetical protein